MVHNFLEIQNTTFVASKLNKVLDFNLTIKNEGDIICLLGPSGIGKTTILRSIAGLQKIPKGSISLKGKILSSEKKFSDKENIGIWFDDKKNLKKVAAIGVRVSKWIAYHGFSININNDLKKYNSII